MRISDWSSDVCSSDLDEESLEAFVEARVSNASASQELGAEHIAPPHLSPPGTRRRASLRAESSGGRIVIGFREGKSHRLVELEECPVLAPELVARSEEHTSELQSLLRISYAVFCLKNKQNSQYDITPRDPT